MAEPITIPFPFKGLDENWAYGDQPAGTSPETVNVRGRDPATGRERGAQRAGRSKFCSAQINGTNPIQCIVAATKIDDRITYTTRTSVDATAVTKQAVLPGQRDVLGMAIDRLSNLYLAGTASGGGSGINYLIKLNSMLQQQYVFPLPMQRSTDVFKSVRLDEEESIYCVVTSSTRSASAGPTRIFKMVEEDFPGPIRIVWFLDAPQGGWFTDCAVKNGVMYAVEDTNAGGVFLHRYDDVNTGLPTLTWSAQIRATAGFECYCVAIADDGAAICGISDPAPVSANGFLEKFGPMAPTGGPPVTPIWSYNDQGVGQAIVVKTSAAGIRYIYSQGYGSGGSAFRARRLIDAGTTVASDAAVTLDDFTTFLGAQTIDVDDSGNTYVTTFGTTDTVVTKLNSSFANVWELTGTHLGLLNLNAFAVIVDPNKADEGGGSEQAEFIYVGSGGNATPFQAIHKVSLVTTTQSDGSPRSPVYLAVSNGALRRFTTGASNTPTGAGTYTFDTTNRFLVAAAAFNRVLFGDGLVGRSYAMLTDTVTNWEATAGEVPRRFRLLTVWQGSALLSGVEADPHNWFKSRGGDLDDFDYFPPALDGLEAVAGNTGRTGQCPDIVTSIFSYSDDVAIFGGDHSIHRLSGNPAAGGRFDQISDTIGISFGMSTICKDPEGVLYFWGTRGGLYMLIPGAPPVSLSEGRLQRRFEQINPTTHKITLAWNPDESGVDIYITPYSAAATKHYFWDRNTNRFFETVFTTTNHDPFAVFVVDGDAWNDRVELIGRRDGYIDQWDVDAKDDDGTAISTAVVLGPHMAPIGREVRVGTLKGVLSSASNAVSFAAYGLETADIPTIPTSLGTAAFTGSWSAGRNTPTKDKVRGRAVYVRLTASTINQRWALEEQIRAEEELAGRVRNR